MLDEGWAGTVPLMAASLGYDVTEVTRFDRRGPAVERREYENAQTVEPGTIGARWFGLTATTDGPTISWEHLTHLGGTIPDEWPFERPLQNGYYLLVQGMPALEVSIRLPRRAVASDARTRLTSLTTPARCTNMVGALCRAEPGIRTIFDFKLGDVTLGRPPGWSSS
jgi:hypothetical protein